MLIYSRFFPERFGHSWLCYLWRDVIIAFPKVIKASWQRMRRGWADCDVWSIDCWFEDVMPGMLRRLVDTKCGIPIDFPGALVSWKKVLLQTANDLEARKRFNEKWFGEEGIYAYPLREQCSQEEEEALDRTHVGVTSFCEYYYNLWD